MSVPTNCVGSADYSHINIYFAAVNVKGIEFLYTITELLGKNAPLVNEAWRRMWGSEANRDTLLLCGAARFTPISRLDPSLSMQALFDIDSSPVKLRATAFLVHWFVSCVGLRRS